MWISAYGRVDLKGIIQSVTKKDYVRYFAYVSEKSFSEMVKNSKESGRSVSYQTVIIDMDQLSPHQMSYKPGTTIVHNFVVPCPIIFIGFDRKCETLEWQ